MTDTTTDNTELTAQINPGRTRRARGTRHQVEQGVWQHAYGRAIPGLNTLGGPSVLRLCRGDWKQRGNCAGLDQTPWFSEADGVVNRHGVALCQDCPVRDLCLAAGLVFHEEFGIWGGLTPAQRQPLLQRLAAGEPLAIVLADSLDTDVEAA